MDEEENAMPLVEWLNSVIGSAVDLADEELQKIVCPFDLAIAIILPNVLNNKIIAAT